MCVEVSVRDQLWNRRTQG